jgi:hypothetical protein
MCGPTDVAHRPQMLAGFAHCELSLEALAQQTGAAAVLITGDLGGGEGGEHGAVELVDRLLAAG